jgi:hypothetical protein
MSTPESAGYDAGLMDLAEQTLSLAAEAVRAQGIEHIEDVHQTLRNLSVNIKAVSLELRERAKKTAEIDRNARAYGWEVGRGHPLAERIESTDPSNPFLAPDWHKNVGCCTCYPGGFTPDTYEGPKEDCPVHGRVTPPADGGTDE